MNRLRPNESENRYLEIQIFDELTSCDVNDVLPVSINAAGGLKDGMKTILN